MWVLLLFIALPLVEIALFVVIGGAIGLWPTLAVVVLSAVAGVVIVRAHGFQALMRLRRSVAAGEDPVGPMAHGALAVLAGLLLIVPGFFTDALGLLLLIPPVRSALIAWAGSRISVRVAAQGAGSERRRTGVEVIEGEYELVDEPSPPAGGSGWTRPR